MAKKDMGVAPATHEREEDEGRNVTHRFQETCKDSKRKRACCKLKGSGVWNGETALKLPMYKLDKT